MMKTKVIFPREYVEITREKYISIHGEIRKSIKVEKDGEVFYLAPLFDLQGE